MAKVVRLGVVRSSGVGSGKRRNFEVLGEPNSETLSVTVFGVLKLGKGTAFFGLFVFWKEYRLRRNKSSSSSSSSSISDSELLKKW
jgi:hypothetical protein